MPKVPKIKSLLIFAVSPKEGYEFDFLPADKHESVLPVDSFFCLCVARHAQSIKNNRFAISLQNLKKNVKDEVDFWPQINIKGFFKLILFIFGLCGQACPN